MTRAKKSRSLKRIHKVKTGSISKFKEQARGEGHDRQSGKRQKKKKLSVYEKFLQDNPEAKARHDAELRAEAEKAAKAKAAADAAQADQDEPAEKTADDEDRRNLLDKLDDKDFGDIY
ncbi:MAG: hypothetical protein CMI02_03680 [Oceanospirillaceae bacterium]|nr:hypothetical protein [Oceanospirillaceae bacterium]MBT11119.1 hypothetical protein [Oceanospirillaceae bacterium]|tara:strand:- start:24260 stop:24613 length:354 start_codon:yes stop_codon:yes gene_type:complete